MSALINSPELVQLTPEWFKLRKSKITATDASIIMGVNPWKTITDLYHEKLSDDPPKPPNAAMQRGNDLEPIARDLFILKTGIVVEPRVIVNDWAMASLDGISHCGNYVVEIKCPGEKDHAIALQGKIPEHYYPQLQHQMMVTDVMSMYYFSFDGNDGVIVEVKRDDKYIENMIDREFAFYQCLQNKTPPKPNEDDYKERDDDIWKSYASKWKSINVTIKELQTLEEEIRKELILLSGQSKTKGAGISLCQVKRKGTVNYGKMLEKLDVKEEFMETFRNPEVTSWRITCH